MSKNTIKWSSIELSARHFLEGYTTPRSELNTALFDTECIATAKFDGTNVGKDEHGVVYGRSLEIDPKAERYQKTSLAQVRSLRADTIKALVCDAAGIDTAHIARFCVYGELMCNKGLYDYAERSLGNTHQVFGAMVQPAKTVSGPELATRLRNAGFAVRFRDGDGGDGGDANDDGANTDGFMVLMTEAFAEIVEATGANTVPLVGRYPSFYAMAVANTEHLKGGFGEGLVVTMFSRTRTKGELDRGVGLPDVTSCAVTKLKNGTEGSANNIDLLRVIAQELADADADESLFGTNTDKAKDLFRRLIEIETSRLINGKVPALPKKKGAGKPKAVKATAPQFSEPEQAEYRRAIASAATKFDNAETFFAKDKMRGAIEYAKLVAEECLADIAVDVNNAGALKRHNDFVLFAVKTDFIAWSRSQSKR